MVRRPALRTERVQKRLSLLIVHMLGNILDQHRGPTLRVRAQGVYQMTIRSCDAFAYMTASAQKLLKRVKDHACDVENAAVDRPSRWSRYPLGPLTLRKQPFEAVGREVSI
jgi:hypothetical protein